MSSSQNERILGGGGILENKQGQIRGEGVQNLAILSEHTFECPPMDGVKTNGGVISVTILLHFHYLISLETANPRKVKCFF